MVVSYVPVVSTCSHIPYNCYATGEVMTMIVTIVDDLGLDVGQARGFSGKHLQSIL
jgi:hypothetical protein